MISLHPTAPALRPFGCVLAADERGGIGKNNDLPWPKLAADLRHFRGLTSSAASGQSNAVIMGRKTWDSVPPKYRPLPDRLNIVISRGHVELPDGVRLAGSLADALADASRAPGVDKIFVVGGGEIYRQAFAHRECRDLFLTRIHGVFDCDTFIADVTEHFAWVETIGQHHDRGITYTIERWARSQT
jgi:dihydrofolate reductase